MIYLGNFKKFLSFCSKAKKYSRLWFLKKIIEFCFITFPLYKNWTLNASLLLLFKVSLPTSANMYTKTYRDTIRLSTSTSIDKDKHLSAEWSKLFWSTSPTTHRVASQSSGVRVSNTAEGELDYVLRADIHIPYTSTVIYKLMYGTVPCSQQCCGSGCICIR
jgi:hypothetical protein